jgi:hypothetical protein
MAAAAGGRDKSYADGEARHGGPRGVGGDVPAKIAPERWRLWIRRLGSGVHGVGRGVRSGCGVVDGGVGGAGRAAPEAAVCLEGDCEAAEEWGGGEALQRLPEALVGAVCRQSVAGGVVDGSC